MFVSVCPSFHAIIFYPFTWKLHFWYEGVSLPYLGQVSVSRSLGQGQGHMRNLIIYLFQHINPVYVATCH